MHEVLVKVLVNRLGGLSLPRKSVVRLTDRPDMTLDVYRGRKMTIQQYNNNFPVHQVCTKVTPKTFSTLYHITDYATQIHTEHNSTRQSYGLSPRTGGQSVV